MTAVSRERDGLEGSFPSRSPDTGWRFGKRPQGGRRVAGQVSEDRLRLADEVRVLREQRLLWREISERLGVSRSYAQALYTDPDGAQAKARKLRYRGVCVDCGGPTTGSEGPSKTPVRCQPCATLHAHDSRAWTQETIIQHFQRFFELIGRSPTVTDVMATMPSIEARLSPARVDEAIRVTAIAPLPPASLVQREFRGGWAEALAEAGLEPEPTGAPGHRGHRRPQSEPRTPTPHQPSRTSMVLDDIDRMLEDLVA